MIGSLIVLVNRLEYLYWFHFSFNLCLSFRIRYLTPKQTFAYHYIQWVSRNNTEQPFRDLRNAVPPKAAVWNAQNSMSSKRGWVLSAALDINWGGTISIALFISRLMHYSLFVHMDTYDNARCTWLFLTMPTDTHTQLLTTSISYAYRIFRCTLVGLWSIIDPLY